MHLRNLHLRNFRLYEDAVFTFSPGINVIKGPNARGKTSIIEALYFLMTGRSFRTSQTADLIRHGAGSFLIEASFVKHGIQQKLQVQYNGSERKVLYNSTPCASSLNLLGLLQGVVIHPDDATIVKGAPACRRNLLDLQLGQSDPLYVRHLTRYDKAMRQRNILLKAKNPATIDVWEEQMAHSAAYIIRQRLHATKTLELRGKEFYRNICGAKEELSLHYKANGTGDNIPAEERDIHVLFSDQFKRHRLKEMELGSTMTGPHKDDVLIALHGKDARGFASEGQQRSCVVALRLAEWERLKSTTAHETPIMLVDDLGISLDAGRRLQLLQHLSSLDQVFITTTDMGSLLQGEHVILMN